MKFPNKVLCSLFTSAALLSTASLADDLVRPEPINQNGRFMPGFGNEALVKARFTVTKDGSTDDIEFTEYLSNQFLKMSLQNTVKCWTFKPATVNGEAIDLYNQEWFFVVRVTPPDPDAAPPGPGGFGGGGGRGGFGGGRGSGCPDTSAMGPAPQPAATPELMLSPEIKDNVDLISGLVSAQDYDKALKEIQKLMRNELHTVFDYSLANELKASVLAATDKPFEALEASKLATMKGMTPEGNETYFMFDGMLESALRKRFLLASSVRQYPLALQTYKELKAKFAMPADDPLHQQAADIQAIVDSPEPMAQIAKIIDKQWTYKPQRRIFTVTNVEGKLKHIDARCERKNLKLDYQEGVDWTLPESLGNCELDFVGKDDTQFVVYEFSE